MKFSYGQLTKALFFFGILTTSAVGMSALAQNISINQSTDGILAKVNDEVVLKSELFAASMALAEQYQAQNIALDPTQIQVQALDALITRKLQLGIINRAGFTILFLLQFFNFIG